MTPELRLLLAGVVVGALLTLALLLVAALYWGLDRREDELHGNLRGGWLDSCPPPAPSPRRRR